MTVSSRFRDSSQRLINRFGALRTYTHKTGEVYDFDTQTNVATYAPYPIKIFKTDPKERETKAPNLVNKEVVVMMIAASDIPFKPKLGDQISESYLDQTNTFNVEVIKENWAGDCIASWRLICIKS